MGKKTISHLISSCCDHEKHKVLTFPTSWGLYIIRQLGAFIFHSFIQVSSIISYMLDILELRNGKIEKGMCWSSLLPIQIHPLPFFSLLCIMEAWSLWIINRLFWALSQWDALEGKKVWSAFCPQPSLPHCSVQLCSTT